jgi:hypothetical protein
VTEEAGVDKLVDAVRGAVGELLAA